MLKLFVLWLAFYVQSSLSFTAKLTPYTSGKHHSCQQKSFLMSNNQKDSSWLSSDKFKACAWNKIPVVLAPIVTWTGAAIAAPLPNKGPLTQATITPTKKPVKGFMRLLNKIVFGSATSSRSLIVGDVSGGAVGLLHALRSVVAVSLFFMVGAFMVKFESISGKSKFQNELLREQKYREEMYIDAVRDIVAKLENPKLRSQVKIDLQKQLQELDSQGIIRQFLKSGSKTPPDLSEYIGKSGRVRNPTATR